MNTKKHYKILIAIILISSSIIYYKSTEKPVNVKYASSSYNDKLGFIKNGTSFVIDSNHNLISHMFINNNEYYLNSTFRGISVTPFSGATTICLLMHITWNYSKINNVKISVSQIKNVYTRICVVNSTDYQEKCYPDNTAVIPRNISNMDIEITQCFPNTGYLNNYNLTVRASLNNNFYSIYYMNVIKETGIYGTVGSKPGCESPSGESYNTTLNSSFFIENANTGSYHVVNIRDGCFYFFARAYTEYNLYYLDNNTLQEFKGNNGTIFSEISSGSPGNSVNKNLYE